jgi:hypothetical protein
MKPTQYVEALGFSGVAEKFGKRDVTQIRIFSYESVRYAQVRSVLGAPSVFDSLRSLAIYKVAKDKVIRVDTENKQVVLGNGKHAAHIITQSVRKA